MDDRFRYTVFLIDDEGPGTTSDPGDALLVCIGTMGTGDKMITSCLEVEIVVELPESEY